MTTEQLILALLSSSVVGGAIGAFIAGRFNLSVKDREYENEYFKRVLAKRIAAYEQLEKLITGLKTAVLANDNQPYHILFSKDDDWLSAFKLIHEISSQALWMSDDLFEKTRDLSRLLFRSNTHEGGLISFGKENYQALAVFREEIERLHIRDMLSLHKVPAFLKSKRAKGGFSEVQLRA